MKNFGKIISDKDIITKEYLESRGYISAITSKMVTDALGFTPFDSAAFTKASIKNALGIADWALAANKPSYDDVYLKLTGGTITGNLTVNGKVSASGLSISTATASLTFTDNIIYSNASLKIYGGWSLRLGANGTGIQEWTDLKTILGLGSLAYKNSIEASDISAIAWDKITGKPTTLSGYGITDAVKYGSGFAPTAADSPTIIGYSGAGEGWPAGGPAMRWGTVGYYARLQVKMASDDNPTIYISKVVNNSAFGWAQVLTDKNFDLFGIANKSNNASGSANDILTSSVNGVVESLTNVPIYYGNLLTFAPKNAYYQSQLIINYQSEMAIRGRSGSWSDWAKVVTDKNFTTYGVKAGSLNTTGSANDIIVPSIVGDVESLQNMPFHYCNILTITTTPHYYVGQIAIDYAGRMASRGKTGSTWSSWRTILDTNNIGTTSLPSLNLNGRTITDWDAVSEMTAYTDVQTSSTPTFTLRPNQKHTIANFSEYTSVAFVLDDVTAGTSKVKFYYIEFIVGTNVPSISFNKTLKWQNGKGISNIVANKTYRIFIDDDLATLETY